MLPGQDHATQAAAVEAMSPLLAHALLGDEVGCGGGDQAVELAVEPVDLFAEVL